MKKTYKREIAVALLLWLAYVVETKGVSIIEILVWPIFTFSALAFGMDWFGKSGGMRDQSTKPTDWGRAKDSSQRTGGEDQHSDGRYDK